MIFNTDRFRRLLEQAEAILGRVERLVPEPPSPWPEGEALAWRWQRSGRRAGGFTPVSGSALPALDELSAIDEQKARLLRNTRQFVRGLPCNNALLSGARGTGKSTLVKALLGALAPEGLRIIEVDASDLVDLPEVVAPLAQRRERFIVFADDLAFDGDGPGYRSLKAVLEGSLAVAPDNVVIYATSNRRHLLPEYMSENLEARAVDGEIHPGETTEEKNSLAERFGLWLSFPPFSEDTFVRIAGEWLARIDPGSEFDDSARRAARQWAMLRGSRSGRAARQFALDHAGRRQLAD